MRLEVYEKIKKRVEDFESQKETLQKKRQKSISDLDEARKQLRGIVMAAGQADGKDMVTAVVTAQARVTIAEEGLRQAEEALSSFPEKPDVVKHAHDSLSAAVRAVKGNSAMLEQELPELRELAELRKQYLSKLEKVMIGVERINDDLNSIQNHTAEVQRKYFGDNASFRNELLSYDDLRKWIWVEGNDYRYDFVILDKKVSGPILPPPPNLCKDVRSLPERAGRGQHVIEDGKVIVSEPKILGRAAGPSTSGM